VRRTLRNDYRAFGAILRTDIYAFARKCFSYLYPTTEFQSNWHLEAFSYELECVVLGTNKRLIVNVPPRSLKSFFISIVFPAFILGTNPTRKIICVSYSQELAVTHAANFRRIVVLVDGIRLTALGLDLTNPSRDDGALAQYVSSTLKGQWPRPLALREETQTHSISLQ
jgi:hypothetical protein